MNILGILLRKIHCGKVSVTAERAQAADGTMVSDPLAIPERARIQQQLQVRVMKMILEATCSYSLHPGSVVLSQFFPTVLLQLPYGRQSAILRSFGYEDQGKEIWLVI